MNYKTIANISADNVSTQAMLAFTLRMGLGSVFMIGGVAKLERLLTAGKADAIVTEYVGPMGYINETFMKWLFSGNFPEWFTPWSFLTTLSAFELISGIMLVVGLTVRPLAVLWALLLWSFVFSLPVVTTPGVTSAAPTYTSPAMFVQVRDIALSGLFFVLYNLGAGKWSLDADRFGLPTAQGHAWEPLGLLMRFSFAIVFLIGGLFHGYAKIMTFGAPGWLLAAIGLGLLAGGMATRVSAALASAVIVWFMVSKLNGATTVIGYFNSIKRELALAALSSALMVVGGGRLFTLARAVPALMATLATYTGKRLVVSP